MAETNGESEPQFWTADPKRVLTARCKHLNEVLVDHGAKPHLNHHMKQHFVVLALDLIQVPRSGERLSALARGRDHPSPFLGLMRSFVCRSLA